MNRYIEPLRDLAGNCSKLAAKLDSQKAQPMTAEEKQLARLAAVPKARKLLDQVLANFAAGRSVENCAAFVEFVGMDADLSDK